MRPRVQECGDGKAQEHAKPPRSGAVCPISVPQAAMLQVDGHNWEVS